MVDSRSLTLGVAITVPGPWGEQLQEQRAAYGDPLAWTIPTHITLLPPTQVPVGRMIEVDEHLREVAAGFASFDVVLNGSDTFRPVTQTSFIVVQRGSAECEQLAARVRSGPLRRSLPFPFHPHVTIAFDLADEVHNRAEELSAGFQLDFAASSVERYELADYGVWESVAEFPLLGAHG